MKKKNIAWLLSAAMILTTAAAPVEMVSVYAAEEFQADETEATGTENGDTAIETIAEIAADVVDATEGTAENETAGAAESEETVAVESDAEGEEETESEVSEENAQVNDASNLEMFDDSAEELNAETEADSSENVEQEAEAENGFSDGEAAVAGEGDSSEVVDSGSCGNDATYTLYGDGRLVIEGSDVVFSGQFKNDERIRSVEVREGITSLEYRTWRGIFEDCKNLTSVTLPKSLTSIGNVTLVKLLHPENV